MPNAALLAGGPVSVLSSTGKQYGIPLSLLSGKDGAVDTSRLDASLAALAAPALKALLASGAISAAEIPAPVLAMTLRAKMAGETGNTIEVTFADVKPNAATPGNTTVDATVEFEDRREGLTPASIGAQLGTPNGGTQPSLVALSAAAVGLPAETAATPLAGSPPSLTIALEDASGDAFTLEAADDALHADVTVAIEDVDTGAGTFTLVVALDHTVNDAKLADLDGKLGAVVGVTAGPGGFAPPAAGTLTLSGGAAPETSAAKTAEAAVLSD